MPRPDDLLHPRAPKKTHCMPTHLPDEEALHVAQEAYERGWSHSQYIRSLVTADLRRKESQAQLDARVSGYATEQYGPFVLCERGERKGRKNGR